MLPATQNPYVYVLNNPVNLTDPTGEIAPLLVAAGVGAAIGAAGGGIGYALAHPGEDYLRSGAFWRAVGVGALSGGVAGAVGFGVGGLVAGGGLGGAISGGILSGVASGAAAQTMVNLLTPCTRWHSNVLEAAVFGGLIGGVAGGAGYGTRQLLRRAAGAIMQRLTTSANTQLAQNPGLASTVLSPLEYPAGQTHPAVARMQYGNAVERTVAETVDESPILRSLFKPVSGPGNPDFVGRSIFAGLELDVTTNTPRSIAGHLGRPYGQDLILLLYTRPPSFAVFP